MTFTIPQPLPYEHGALRETAARTRRSEIVAFADALVERARTEQELMRPVAVLVGRVVRQRLAARAGAGA